MKSLCLVSACMKSKSLGLIMCTIQLIIESLFMPLGPNFTPSHHTIGF